MSPLTAPVTYVRAYKEKSLQAQSGVSERDITRLIELLAAAREGKRQIFMCGNGGSAATASHFASELGKGASYGREKKFRVLSLTDNVSWITALANDLDYAQVFVEQLKSYAQEEDLLIAFSSSGNSPNVLRAVEWGNENGLTTVGIAGRPGSGLGKLARHVIFVESPHLGHIEEGHFLIQHVVGYYFMETDGAGIAGPSE